MLTTEAFNALLKTLEEPPPHVTFVLATTEPHKLPNTILSRCQRYDFKLVPAQRLAQHLTEIFKKEKLKIDAGAVSLVVRESGGSVRDALSLCDQIISYVGEGKIEEKQVAEVLGVADRSLTRGLVRALATGDAGAALSAVEAALDRGVDEVQLARAIVRYLRDLAVLQVAPDRTELVDASDEERAELRSEASSLDKTRTTQMFDRMLRCCDELGKTLQPRLVLDCALIDVATIEPLVPLGDLIARLGELENRVRTGAPPRAAAPKPAPAPAPPPKPPARPHESGPVVVAPSGPVPKLEKAASGSGPHSVPSSPAEVLREWEHVLEKLSAINITLSGAFEPARVLAWTADRLELGFPSQFEANKDMAEGKVEALREVLKAEFAQAPKVTVKLVEDSEGANARSVLEATREKTHAERTKREAEAREHPITKHVLQTFGGHIKEIKTDV
jgi:DNA polymerase-3 subunit gamma/tau